MSEYIDKYIEEIANHKRVTEKISEGVYDFFPLTRCNNGFDIDNALLKLGKLEDIEDELGIDLLTLMKALMNGFYVVDGTFHTISFERDNIRIEEFDLDSGGQWYICFENSDYGGDYPLSEYGKTWALTKEELQK